MDELLPIALKVGQALLQRGETVAVAESSSGGLISAALLAIPGASAFYVGGGVIYTARARHRLLNLGREDVAHVRSASEPYAEILAGRVRETLGVSWGLSETGAAGPTGNPYGDAAGHTCVAVVGPVSKSRTLETGIDDRAANMRRFAAEALELLKEALAEASGDAGEK
jgi:PncC family amidohydrolase